MTSIKHAFTKETSNSLNFDIRRWGGIVDSAPGNEAANDLAFADMIASSVPTIFLPGPIMISKTIAIPNNRAISIVGTNPGALASSDDETGGIIVTGTDTAQTNACIEIINGREQRIDNVRFFGHVNGASTPCHVGVSVIHDSVSFSDALHGSHAHISNCLFAALTDAVSMDNCIEFNNTGVPAGAAEFHVDNCTFKFWAEKAIWIENGQSVWGEISNCLFDGRATAYADFAEHGVYTEANTTIRNCGFNRCQVALEVMNQNIVWMTECSTEKVRTFVKTSNQVIQELHIHNCRHVMDNVAYTDSVTKSDRPLIRARCKVVDIENLQVLDQLSGAPRPHFYLGEVTGTSGSEARIRITGCSGITLDDIDAETNVGLPLQGNRRLNANNYGTWFEWTNNIGDQRQIRKWLGVGVVELD